MSEVFDEELHGREFWREIGDFVERHSARNWIFRGVADSIAHKLVPKVGRAGAYPGRPDENLISLDEEISVFREFQRRAWGFVEAGGFNDWDHLALAQHHGLPTRLLDWTTNPLIAAYFAVRSEPGESDGRIYAVSGIPDATVEDGPFGQSDVRVYRPNAVGGRIVAQRGLFTVSPQPHRPIDETSGIQIDHIEVPNKLKRWLRRRLSQIGFDPASVMMDLDGLCRAVDEQHGLSLTIDLFS